MPYDIIIGRNESDKKAYGKRGVIFIGKGYVKMGQYTSLSNKIYMDVVRSHVLLLAGKRGSGKSYTLGVIAEEMTNLPKEVSQNIAPLIFDTMGIYWTMKIRNEKDKELLTDWGLKPKTLPVKVFVPFGHFDKHAEEGVPVDKKFALDASELTAEDWILTFDLNFLNPVSVLFQKIIGRMKKQGKRFTITDIIKKVEKDEMATNETKNAAMGLLEAADNWGIFAKKDTEPTRIEDLFTGGLTTVLDLSVYNSIGAFSVRALVVSLVSRKIFNQRMAARKKEEIKEIATGLSAVNIEEKQETPLAWLFIDEAHEFLPENKKTVATDALVQLLREGRQPGVSLVLATQQPGKIHGDVMTQSDLVLSHRVTSAQDINALNQIMQTYVMTGIREQMNNLPSLKGSAIVLDDNSERIYSMRMRPRFTWHGGEAPRAIKENKEF
jgi:uncharacterized protein